MHCKGHKIWIAAFSAISLSLSLPLSLSYDFILAFIYLKADVILCLRGSKTRHFQMQMRVSSSGIWETCVMICWRLWRYKTRQFQHESAWFLQWAAGNNFRQMSFFKPIISLTLSSSLAELSEYFGLLLQYMWPFMKVLASVTSSYALRERRAPTKGNNLISHKMDSNRYRDLTLKLCPTRVYL